MRQLPNIVGSLHKTPKMRRQQVYSQARWFDRTGFDVQSPADGYSAEQGYLWFLSRQKRSEVAPVLITTTMRWTTAFKSGLQDFKSIGFQSKKLNRLELLKSRIVEKIEFTNLEEPCSIHDAQAFDELVDELKTTVSKQDVKDWIANATPFPLSPMALEQLIHAPEKLESADRKMAAFSYNKHSTGVLFIGAEPEEAEQIFERMFPADRDQFNGLDLSPVGGDYIMQMREGQTPQLISEPEQSTVAIVYNDDRNKFYDALDHYKRLLNCPLRSVKRVFEAERKWIEKRSGKDLSGRDLAVLEFESVEARNDATQSLSALNVLSGETMFSLGETFEEVVLSVHYDQKKRSTVKVTLANEADKLFFREAMEANRCQMTYEKDSGLYDPNNREIILLGCPEHLTTFDEKVWLIRRIAAANEIEIEKTEHHTIGNTRPSWRRRTDHPKNCIDYELYNIAHHKNIYRPLDMEWDITLTSRRGARHYTRDVARRADCPWKVERTTKQGDVYVVKFKNAEDGHAIVNGVLDRYRVDPIFRNDNHDAVGPSVIPLFRKTFTITRQMRVAFDEAIQEFDRHIRDYFTSLLAREDRSMTLPQATHFRVRVYEVFQPEVETGRIGVEGWNKKVVEFFFKELQTLLRPIRLHTEIAPDLLFGVGEAYVRSLEQTFGGKVLIDIDKYQQSISIFGDHATEARQLLIQYQHRKANINVVTEFSATFPFFNDLGRKVVTPKTMHRLAAALSAKCVLNKEKKTVEFHGTIEAYEKLTTALGEISSEVFNRQVPAVTRQELFLFCTVCWVETDKDDFYRLECGHEMCRACLNNWISTNIQDCKFHIKCEVRGCNKPVAFSEIKSLILGDTRRVRELDGQKLENFAGRVKESLIMSNPTLKPCRTPDCVGILVSSPDTPNVNKKCGTCKAEYCSQCAAVPHPGETCAKYASLQRPDVSIKEFVDKIGRRFIKQCPVCSIWVMKEEGCDHMECGCGTHFCWQCRFVSKTSGDMYSHMEQDHGTYGGEEWIIGHDGFAVDPNGEEIDLDVQRAVLGEGVFDIPEPEPIWEPRRRGPARIIPAPRPEPQPPQPVELVRQAPRRPRLLVFPQILLDMFPVFYEDEMYQDALVEHLNNARTDAEFNEWLAELFEKPQEQERRNRERLEQLNREN